MRFGAVFLIVAAIWSIGLQGAASAATAQSALEYSVKANYLVRFAAFVDWPPQAFADARAPVTICVIGRDPFGQGLDRAAAAQTAFGRPLQIRRPATAVAAAGCNLLYVGEGGTPVVQGVGVRQGMLVVTDGAVSSRRGMIHFVIDDARVRFHIDAGAARAAGLAMSSRLLGLALTVRGR